MAFSPTQSPVYGGDTLSITLSLDQLLQSSATSSTASLPPSAEDAKYFVVFEGSRRRHVVSARPVQGSGRPLVHAEDIVTGHVAMEDAETKDSYIHLQTVIPGTSRGMSPFKTHVTTTSTMTHVAIKIPKPRDILVFEMNIRLRSVGQIDGDVMSFSFSLAGGFDLRLVPDLLPLL
ncbi:hypothetical protein RRG08_022620 [Elysia crispata]|uniref:Uncharacterized protein n=1 Tax=Elysia crispata TaxID=231223 RepID=A0AAE1D916_9GAST|nr:hypothetical protein RRG08_022620 [Elysia crispata]